MPLSSFSCRKDVDLKMQNRKMQLLEEECSQSEA